MSLNSINKLLASDKFWKLISTTFISLYLSPLLITNGNFYVPIFDNLDSNVVWYKILAESGMIFAGNNEIIPNMLNGLPRSSYPGEFNIILWLYYFFTPIIAFVINEVAIHLVAFFSMFVFLKRYIIIKNNNSKNIFIYAGSLYFALMPYWSGAGLTIAILPLVTYSLINIKNRVDNSYDWLLLVLLPLYTSFIFFYLYYIILFGLYILYCTLKEKKLDYRLFTAILLMGIVFLLSEYRLVISMFLNDSYTSHREEFNIYFDRSLLESYRTSLVFFLDGHISHANALQGFYILPTIIIAMFLSLLKRRLTAKESILVYTLILLSFLVDIWAHVLTQLYTLPLFLLFALYLYFSRVKYRKFSLLLIFLIVLALYNGLTDCECIAILIEIFPIFKKLSLIRLSFILPFIYAILFVLSLNIISRKLHYANIFITFIILFQISISLFLSSYQSTPRSKYASFEQYYAPELFQSVTKTLNKPIENVKIISYGIEPAVALYNKFHTLDGYIVNYPLDYKYAFRDIIAPYLDNNTSLSSEQAVDIYDNWGSKVYILSTVSTLHFYKKDVKVNNPQFNTNAICKLGADYMFSSREIINPNTIQLKYINHFIGKKNSWDIYVYELDCL